MLAEFGLCKKGSVTAGMGMVLLCTKTNLVFHPPRMERSDILRKFDFKIGCRLSLLLVKKRCGKGAIVASLYATLGVFWGKGEGTLSG